jgi:uncharacterized protein (UPF0332 family)
MKAESERLIVRAKQALAKAEKILDMEICDVAARQAYIAALAASRALTYEQFGRAPRTHKGMKSLMHDLARRDPRIDRRLLGILEYGFGLKVTADYGDAEQISVLEARRAIELAQGFIETIEKILAAN